MDSSRPYVHENFEKFKIISTPTGSWIRSRRRRDRIQLPVGVEIILNFLKFFMNIGTELSTLSMGHSVVTTLVGTLCKGAISTRFSYSMTAVERLALPVATANGAVRGCVDSFVADASLSPEGRSMHLSLSHLLACWNSWRSI